MICFHLWCMAWLAPFNALLSLPRAVALSLLPFYVSYSGAVCGLLFAFTLQLCLLLDDICPFYANKPLFLIYTLLVMQFFHIAYKPILQYKMSYIFRLNNWWIYLIAGLKCILELSQSLIFCIYQTHWWKFSWFKQVRVHSTPVIPK